MFDKDNAGLKCILIVAVGTVLFIAAGQSTGVFTLTEVISDQDNLVHRQTEEAGPRGGADQRIAGPDPAATPEEICAAAPSPVIDIEDLHGRGITARSILAVSLIILTAFVAVYSYGQPGKRSDAGHLQ